MKIGSHVLYSTKGICKVDKMESRKFSNETKDYYVLTPVFDKSSTYYVPVDYDCEKIMIRQAVTQNVVDELMAYSKKCPPLDWPANANERKELEEEILKSADHKRIIRLIKTLKLYEELQKKSGKKMYLSDTKALKSAVKLISNEFAFVRGEDPQVVEEFFNPAI